MLARFLLFIFAIPVLAALGHDLYLFYENQEKGFNFATIGFIWSQYEEQSLREFMRPFDDEQREMAGFVLSQYASAVGGAIFAMALLIFGLVHVFGGGSYRSHDMPKSKRENRLDRVMGRQKSKRR